MPSQTDLDQGGTFRGFVRQALGPSLGRVDTPNNSLLPITIGGTYTLDPSVTLVTINTSAAVTIFLPVFVDAPTPPAVARPGLYVNANITFVDIGGAPNVTINASGTQTINGLASTALVQSHQSIVLGLLPNGNWYQAMPSPAVPSNPLNLYVSASGNDSWNGLSPNFTSGTNGPVLTLQRASNIAAGYDMDGQSIIVNVGAGSFAGATFTGPMRGAAGGNNVFNLIVSGAGQTSTNITANPSGGAYCILAELYSQVLCQHLNIAVPNNFTGIFTQDFASVSTNDCRMTGAGAGSVGFHIEDYCTAEFATPSPCDFYGTFNYIATMGGTGYFLIDSGVFNLHGTIASFVLLDLGSCFVTLLTTSPIVFVGGTATGLAYNVFGNSYLSWNATTTLTGIWLGAGGSIGQVATGGRTIGAIGPPTATCTGIGSTGTATLLTGSDGRGGTIILTPSGTGIVAVGTAILSLKEQVSGVDEATAVQYVATLSNGTGTWNARATVFVQPVTASSSVVHVGFAFDNNSVNLTTGQVYYINYMAP